MSNEQTDEQRAREDLRFFANVLCERDCEKYDVYQTTMGRTTALSDSARLLLAALDARDARIKELEQSADNEQDEYDLLERKRNAERRQIRQVCATYAKHPGIMAIRHILGVFDGQDRATPSDNRDSQ